MRVRPTGWRAVGVASGAAPCGFGAPLVRERRVAGELWLFVFLRGFDLVCRRSGPECVAVAPPRQCAARSKFCYGFRSVLRRLRNCYGGGTATALPSCYGLYIAEGYFNL